MENFVCFLVNFSLVSNSVQQSLNKPNGSFAILYRFVFVADDTVRSIVVYRRRKDNTLDESQVLCVTG